MENNKQKQAEDRLQEMATKIGVPVKEIYALCNQAYINEENFQKRLYALRQSEYQANQLQVWEHQLRNEFLQNQIMSYKLARIVRWNNRKTWFKSLFTKKTNGNATQKR